MSYSEIKNRILELSDQAERDKECAYWLLDCFTEIYPRPLPSIPHEILEYNAMTHKEKLDAQKNGLFFISKLKEYFDQKSAIQAENLSNYHTLKTFIAYIPEQDVLNRCRYQEKIKEFEWQNNG